jgi:hypothetical protein
VASEPNAGPRLIGRGAVRCVSTNVLTQRIALPIPTRKIRPASFRERPSSTALITRMRRASPCAILAGLVPVARMNHASLDLGIPYDSIRPRPALEYRQQGIEALRSPRPLRKDRRGEADFLFRAHLASVAHLDATDLDRSNPGLYGPMRPIAVSHHAIATIQQLQILPPPRRSAPKPAHDGRRHGALRSGDRQ